MESQSINPPYQTPAPSPTSVPMTPQVSNTTVVGVDEVMTPVSSSAHSEMGDLDTERAISSLPNTPSPQVTPKPKIPIPIEPIKEVRTLIDLPVDVLKEIVKEAGTPSFQSGVAYAC